MACSQMCSGMWLASKMVPTVTRNGLRQTVALVDAKASALAGQLANAVTLLAAWADWAGWPKALFHPSVGGFFGYGTEGWDRTDAMVHLL